VEGGQPKPYVGFKWALLLFCEDMFGGLKIGHYYA